MFPTSNTQQDCLKRREIPSGLGDTHWLLLIGLFLIGWDNLDQGGADSHLCFLAEMTRRLVIGATDVRGWSQAPGWASVSSRWFDNGNWSTGWQKNPVACKICHDLSWTGDPCEKESKDEMVCSFSGWGKFSEFLENWTGLLELRRQVEQEETNSLTSLCWTTKQIHLVPVGW